MESNPISKKEGKNINIKAILYKIGTILCVMLSILSMAFAYSEDIIVGEYMYYSVFHIADFTTSNGGIHLAGMALLILFIADAIMFIVGIITIFKKKIKGMYLSVFTNLFSQIVALFLQINYGYTSLMGVFLLAVNLILSIISIALLVIYQKKYVPIISSNETSESTINSKKVLMIVDIISVMSLLSLFLVPLFSYSSEESSYTFWLAGVLFSEQKDIILQIAFIGVFIAFISVFVYFVHSLAFYFNYEKDFVKKSNNLVYSCFALSLVYFLVGYFLSLIYSEDTINATTISFIPFIITTLVLVVYSIVKGKYKFLDENVVYERKPVRFEPLIYLVFLTVTSCCILFINVIEVKFEYLGNAAEEAYTGLELLQNYSTIGGGYQLMAFVIFAIMVASFVLLIICTCAFFAKYKDYYKLVKTSVYTNVIFMFVLGMSGIYFSMAQKINEENILMLLSSFGFDIAFEYVNELKSQTFILFIVALIVLIVAIFRGQLNFTADKTEVASETHNVAPSVSAKEDDIAEPVAKDEDEVIEEQQVSKEILKDFDACPVFTELDAKKAMFTAQLHKRENYKFEEPTLPSLVKFIVDYARECRLHLSYTHEDIATFVAGLGASRLTILQGMSGTGKTSLPKIFAEAVLGNCEIVEVESSWRDKNELLGYYNEFSKTYSPKKFTQRLYKAKLNPNVVTFIVLDEMNLSRIEYYFSDFLSLMEHEEKKREIKLLNVKLQRIENNEKIDYLALEEGHTIKIPTNVWFIGTANRDESTFEISDKVYDRAQTMNFNKRAPKVRSYDQPIPQRYLPYEDLSRLLKDAIANGNFEAEDSEIIKEVEKILQPFNISFGNRVLKQIEEFVKIYCACFNNPDEVLNEAVEKILLSKVVAKLEFKNVDNKDKLVKQFNKLNLFACSEFVSKLNED